MSAWKLAQALQHNFVDCNEAAPILVIQSRSTAPVARESLLEVVFPLGKRTPVQRVQELAAAVQLARQILDEAGARLDREMDKTAGTLERLQAPGSELAVPAYELTCQGLQEHWRSLELLDAVLSGDETELLEQAVRMAERADYTLDRAEDAARNARQDVPLVA